MALDEKSIKGELEGYLRERDMNEFFTSIIESCLMTQPENPSLHIMKHLMKSYPSQVPPTVGAAIDAHFRDEAMKVKVAASLAAARKGGGGGNSTALGSAASAPGTSAVSSSGESTSLASSQAGPGGGGLAGSAEEDDEALLGEKHTIDGLVVKFMAVAAEAGVHVRLGGWRGHGVGETWGGGGHGGGGAEFGPGGSILGGFGRLATDDADIHGGDATTRAEEALRRIREIAKVSGRAHLRAGSQGARLVAWARGSRAPRVRVGPVFEQPALTLSTLLSFLVPLIPRAFPFLLPLFPIAFLSPCLSMHAVVCACVRVGCSSGACVRRWCGGTRARAGATEGAWPSPPRLRASRRVRRRSRRNWGPSLSRAAGTGASSR